MSKLLKLPNLKTLTMAFLGLSSGLPFLLVFSTLSVWLREAGISRSDIGLLSWVGVAYTLKFLWAPVIDNWPVPVLERYVGRNRAWMIVAQSIIVVGLVGIATGSPQQSVLWITVWALVVAFGSATQDVTIDAWRINVAPHSEQGNLAAVYQLGYRIGLITGGAGALYIADAGSWAAAYHVMAALMAVAILCSIFATNVGISGRTQVQRDLKTALLEMFRHHGLAIVLILAVIALYRIPDFVGGVMSNTLYVDLGFTKTDIANVSKVVGVVLSLLGAFAGGFAISRGGLLPALVVGAVVAATSNLMLAWLALAGNNYDLFVSAVSIESFSGGFAGTVLIAYMSAQVNPLFAATQYALLSSFFALPGKFLGGFSGQMVDAIGYPSFYVSTALMGIPAIGLCLLLLRDSPDRMLQYPADR